MIERGNLDSNLPSLDERVRLAQLLIASNRRELSFFQKYIRFYEDPEDAPTTQNKIRSLQVALVRQGGRLGGLVTAQRRQNERR